MWYHVEVYNIEATAALWTCNRPWCVAILCLWNIQLTLDWVGMEPHGAYPRKSELKRCKRVQEILKSDIFRGSYRNFRSGKVNANGQ